MAKVMNDALLEKHLAGFGFGKSQFLDASSVMPDKKH